MTREPLLSAAGITAAASAVIGLLTVFGLNLSTEQTTAILAVVAVLAPIVVGLASRGKVTPVAAPQDDAGNPLTPAPLAPEDL